VRADDAQTQPSSSTELGCACTRTVGVLTAKFTWISMFSPSEACMAVEFTAVYQEVSEGFIAFVEELPGFNTQGTTLDEARANLREAVALVMEDRV
jgi:hypothetical protein